MIEFKYYLYIGTNNLYLVCAGRVLKSIHGIWNSVLRFGQQKQYAFKFSFACLYKAINIFLQNVF